MCSLLKRHNSVLFRLSLCLIVMLIVVASVTMIQYSNTFVTAKQAAYRDAAYFSNIISEELNNSLALIDTAARSVGYNISIQDYLVSDIPRIVIENANSAQTFFDLSFYSGIECENVYLISQNGRYLYQRQKSIKEFRQMLNETGLLQSLEVKKAFYARADIPGDGGNCFFYVLPIYHYNMASSVNPIICAVLFDGDVIIERLSEYIPELGTVGILFENELIYSSVALTNEELAHIQSSETTENESVRIGKANYHYTKCTAAKSGAWQVFYLLSDSDVTNRAAVAFIFSLLYSVGAILCIIAFFILIFLPIQMQIKGLVDNIHRLKPDSAGKQLALEEARLNELNQIVLAINDLNQRLNDANQQVQVAQKNAYEALLAQKNAELLGYRSQINPHFIFNSLESLRTAAYLNSDYELARMIASMAGLYRYTIYAPMLVPISQELENINNYLTVMNLRFPNRFQLRTKISDELLKQRIQSMTLQPIVENCVHHAFPRQQKLCIIRIEALSAKDGAIRILITDNGCGLTEAELERMRSQMKDPNIVESSNSIGLKNIYNRLKLTFDVESDVIFRSSAGHYTQIELYIPQKSVLENLDGQEGEAHVQNHAG